MTTVKNTRKALLMSAVSLLLCFAMLLGTTFAWFTDSASSGSNVITSGTLDIVVDYTLDGTNWKSLDGAKDLFQKGLWEPGHTEVVAVRVTNNGNLALKYSASMNIIKEYVGKTKDGSDIKLSEILMVSTAVTDASAVAAAFASDSAIAGATATPFKSANVLANDETLLQQGEVDYIIIKVDMAETVGNEANHNGIDVPAIEFGLNFFATQYTYENDSFGPNYDVDSKYPVVGTASVPANTIEPTLITAGDVSVYVPAMANEGEYKLEIENKSVEDTADGTVAAYEIKLTRDGQAVSGVTFPVYIQMDTYMDIKSLKHNGEPISDFKYDKFSGIISFTTTSFSPFEVTYTALVSGTVVKGGVYGGIDWILTDDGTLTVTPATTPAPDPNSGAEYEIGVWREAVVYKTNGSASAIGGYPYDVTAVKSLVIADGVTSIGSFTAKFPNLTGEVVIPASVTYVGQEAFQGCPITKLTFAEGGTEKLCIAPGAFKALKVKEISLPADRSVCIGCWAFVGCKELESITLPATVIAFPGWTHVDYCGMDYVNGWDSQILSDCPKLTTITFGSQEVHDKFFAASGNRANINALDSQVTIVIQ